jgi:hypothetical protein
MEDQAAMPGEETARMVLFSHMGMAIWARTVITEMYWLEVAAVPAAITEKQVATRTDLMLEGMALEERFGYFSICQTFQNRYSYRFLQYVQEDQLVHFQILPIMVLPEVGLRL